MWFTTAPGHMLDKQAAVQAPPPAPRSCNPETNTPTFFVLTLNSGQQATIFFWEGHTTTLPHDPAGTAAAPRHASRRTHRA